MPTPKYQFRKLADLKPNPRNARKHSEAQVAQLEGLIRRFGWTAPVVADADMIDGGHSRCMAAESIYAAGDRIYMAPGEAHGGMQVPDGCVPVQDSTGWTEEEKRAYALAENQSALNSTWDEVILNEELTALLETDFDMALVGFDMNPVEPTETQGRTPGPLVDTNFQHVDQYGIIIRCADATEQEARFNTLRDQFGAENVKVVVV